MEPGNQTETRAPAAAEPGAVRWDTAGSKSSYCNVASAHATRDAVVLNFGLSHKDERGPAELSLELLHQVVLSPRVAKNLQDLLSRLIAEHGSSRGNPR